MKLPLSVLVVVHTAQREVLLLERAARSGFWQSVTGSLDAPDEPLAAAAARELREETGLDATAGRLRRLPVAYTFEIYQRWRHRFAPGVTHNTEHLFSFELAERARVALAPQEHTAFAWLPWRAAAEKCFSWSNRDAIGLIGAVLLAAGCASTEAPLAKHLDSGPPEVRECAHWYRALDAEIDAAGVRDAQHTRVPGFPHLRVDRLHASLRERAAQSEAALQLFAERLQELDLDSRRHEVQNLPSMSGEAARTQALRRASDCGRMMRAADLASSESRAALLAAARVPDDRPLKKAARPVGVERPAAAASVRYAPPAAGSLPRDAVAGLLGRATFDPLGQLGLTAREVHRLASAYAPSFEIEIGSDYDRFGWLRWLRGSRVLQVDPEPTVYIQSAYTRYQGHVLLQLVYTIWFAERPPHDAVDSPASRLDGLVWRVTLAPDGEPLVYDSIHPSGAAHLFFPTPRAKPVNLEEQAQSLPRLGDGERPVVMIASGTHAIRGVGVVRGADSLVRYALRPYDELRSMPRAVGIHASAFGADGRMAGTEMRQWGRQATAVAGRRHFDDADLFERRFEFTL
jgi:8-oxo-dGTP pyrophosphatase MutT (NUDIX family)